MLSRLEESQVNFWRVNAIQHVAVGDFTTAALFAVHDASVSAQGDHFEVSFPAGDYVYDNNTWLNNTGSMRLRMVGCTSQNTFDQLYLGDKSPFGMSDITHGYGDDRPGEAVVVIDAGSFIQSVSAGSREIELVDPEDAAGFLPGMRVFIYGFDQQFFASYPFNARYFEWATVQDVAGGVVTLTAPLQFAYSTDWRDNAEQQGGKPRMVSLERPSQYYPRNIEIIGPLTILQNPASAESADNTLFIMCDTLTIRQVEHLAGGTSPTQCRWSLYDRCELGYVEVDKLMGYIEFRSCIAKQFDLGSGAHEIVVSGGEIGPPDTTQAPILLRPRKLTIKDNPRLVNAPEHTFGVIGQGGWPIQQLVVESMTIAAENSDDLDCAINEGNAQSVTVTATDGADILLADDDPGKVAVSGIMPGALMWRSDFANRGRCTDVTWDGARHVIRGDWPLAPADGEVWKYLTVQSVSVSGITWEGTPRPALAHWRLPQLGGTQIILDQSIIRPSASQTYPVEVFGTLTRIRLEVTSGYTGSDPEPQMFVTVFEPVYGYQAFIYPLGAPGYVECLVGSSSWSPAGAAKTAIPTDHMCSLLKILCTDLSGTVEQLPSFTLEIEGVSAWA